MVATKTVKSRELLFVLIRMQPIVNLINQLVVFVSKMLEHCKKKKTSQFPRVKGVIFSSFGQPTVQTTKVLSLLYEIKKKQKMLENCSEAFMHLSGGNDKCV